MVVEIHDCRFERLLSENTKCRTRPEPDARNHEKANPAEAANKAGGKVENVVLPEIGIRGNSHLLMQDWNSLEIADSNASSSPLDIFPCSFVDGWREQGEPP